jgi:hypothetical protein
VLVAASALLVVLLRLLFEEMTRKELEGRNFEGLGMKEGRKDVDDDDDDGDDDDDDYDDDDNDVEGVMKVVMMMITMIIIYLKLL